jgi:hypothetical protein
MVAGSGGYHGLGKLHQAPAAAQVVPRLKAAVEVGGAAASATPPVTQPLAPLTNQQQPEEPATAPVAAQSPPAAPGDDDVSFHS